MPEEDEVKARVLALLKHHYRRTYSCREVVRSVGIRGKEGKNRVKQMLIELKEAGDLLEVTPGRYQSPIQGKRYEGRVELTRSGTAYVILKESGRKVFVTFEKLKHALDGDIVEVLVYAGQQLLQGEVLKIVRRKRSVFAGVIHCFSHFAFFIPMGRQLPYDVYLPRGCFEGAHTGDRVLVEVYRWPRNYRNPEGRLVKILVSREESEGWDPIIPEFALPVQFPVRVVKQAEKIKEEIPEAELKNRRDFRSIPTFTIDPVGACDFDDALSLLLLPGEEYEVGVHIADVSYFIKPGSLLDREAYRRTCSVYLVGHTVPMLPEHLSHHICSLRPGRERLCFSVVFTLNRQAEIRKMWIGRTVIRSDVRFTYEEADAVLRGEISYFGKELRVLSDIAMLLRQKRLAEGALCFNRPEVGFVLDGHKKPLEIYFKVETRAHQLVEEWMLLANRSIAEWVSDRWKKRFIYRVHEPPKADRWLIFQRWLRKFGQEWDFSDEQELSVSLREVLQRVRGKSCEGKIMALAVRLMTKAAYSIDNTGHYGLAFRCYTHFTSPIRRYSDLMVHRLLERYMAGKRSANRNKYQEICRHISSGEMTAANAESASVRYKQLEYLLARKEQEWEGRVTEINKWGFYVELNEVGCEGLVTVYHMEDDYYEFDKRNYCIRGRLYGRCFRLEDQVVVKVLSVNLYTRLLDFVLAGEAAGWKKCEEIALPVRQKCEKRKGRKRGRIK